VIEGDHPVNLRTGEVQLLGDDPDGSGWNVAERRLDGVQYFQEWTRSLTMLRDDASDGSSLFGR
jgi:hypothetical protein